MKTPRIAVDGLHQCDNCGTIHDAINLNGIENIHHRVEAGNMVPSGECPKCGALCYPYTKRIGRKTSNKFPG